MDAAAVTDLGRRFAALADGMDDAMRSVAGGGDDVARAWQGPGADAFARYASDFTRAGAGTGDAARAAQGELADLGRTLQTLRDEVAGHVSDALDAAHARAGALGTPSVEEVRAAVAEPTARAQEALDRAEAEVAASARRLRALTGDDDRLVASALAGRRRVLVLRRLVPMVRPAAGDDRRRRASAGGADHRLGGRRRGRFGVRRLGDLRERRRLVGVDGCVARRGRVGPGPRFGTGEWLGGGRRFGRGERFARRLDARRALGVGRLGDRQGLGRRGLGRRGLGRRGLRRQRLERRGLRRGGGRHLVVGTGRRPPGQVGDWIRQATAILAEHGVPTDKMDPDDIATIIDHESGGDPDATNGWDSNAAKGTPSQGLMQTIGPTFAAHKLPGHGDIHDPVDNIIAGVRYAIERYGSVSNVPGVEALARGGRTSATERGAAGTNPDLGRESWRSSGVSLPDP